MSPLSLKVKILLNRVQYDPTPDIAYISSYLDPRGIRLSFETAKTDLRGYSVEPFTNVFGNTQNILRGGAEISAPLFGDADICVLALQSFKEFGSAIPSESATTGYIPGTRTVFVSANADDPFSDTVPNFRVWLLHELLHAIGAIARERGFDVQDCLDTYVTPQGQVLHYHMVYDPFNVSSAPTVMIERMYESGFLKTDWNNG